MDSENLPHTLRWSDSRIYFADKDYCSAYQADEAPYDYREINNLANSIDFSADFSVASCIFDQFCKSIEKQKELKIKIEDVL